MKLFRSMVVCLGTAVTLLCVSAQADNYPSRPISLVVPWNAGGSADLIARKLADILGKSSISIVVENVPGATSIIGLTRVANAAPDGYTVGIVTSSLMGMVTQKATKLRVDDFTALNQIAVDQVILVVPKASPVNNIDDLIREMRRKSGAFSIGTPGANNVNHGFAAMLAHAAGVEYINVPFTGGARVLADLAGSQIDAAVLKPSETSSHIQGGLIKAIGVFSHERVNIFPDVPTFSEKDINIFPFGALDQLSYLVAQKGLPTEKTKKLQEIFGKAITSKEYQYFTQQYGIKIADVRGDDLQNQVLAIQRTFDTVAPKIFATEK